MLLAERHLITKSNRYWEDIDLNSFRGKNLYNATLYIIRQHFFDTSRLLSFKEVYYQVKADYPQDYSALPRKVSNQVLKQVYGDWINYFKALKAYKKDASGFSGKPQIPGYKDKQAGRGILVYEKGAISKVALDRGVIKVSGLAFQTTINPEKVTRATIKEVRIVPQSSFYVLEVVYEREADEPIASEHVASIDMGVNNLAAITSNKPGLRPFLVNGRPVKSVNHYYNKQQAKLQALLQVNQHSSHQIRRLTQKRNLKINDYLHKASRLIVDWCKENQIATLVIGKNDGWKQAVDMGKRNNQNFVQIPHARFIEMLEYKSKLAGIKTVIIEESYTSKCSFLDLETIAKHETYAGKRIKRGLFRASDGRLINADVNGSYNILRKAVPNAFANGIEAVAVQPLFVSIPKRIATVGNSFP
jgi:putative transposase